jgi:hypothetical protein
MADNTQLSSNIGTGDQARTIDKTGVKTQVVTLDVGGAGAESLVAGTVPVSGTVAVTGAYQATQPVSDAGGSLTVDGTVGVSGTVTVDGSGVTQPVSGTFWQATQPVSGTVAVSTINSVAPAFGTGVRGATVQRVTVATDDSVPVTGTFYQATQPVSIATAPVLVAGAAIIGKVGIDQTTPGTTNAVAVTTINSVAPAFGSGVRGATVQRVTIATDDSVPVTIASVPSHAVTNAGTFATQESQILADNAGFTDGTTKVFAAGYIYDEVAGTALTENDVAAPRININRAVVSAIEDGATRARYATVTASNALKVDGSAATQPVSGTVSITANSAVNVAQVNGVTTLMGNGVTGTGSQRVTVASDNTPFPVKTDQTTHGTTDLVAADITKVAGTAIVTGGVAGSQSIGGTVATNVAITANPVNLGAQAVSSENAAVTTARQVQLVADLVGKLIVLPYANPENFVSGAITTAMTSTTTTSLVAAPAAGLRNYITQITVSNAHATVGTDIIIQDGSGGTTLYTIPAAANYGGATLTFPTPLRQPTTATALFCANVTTGASTKVSASGYKGA